MGQATEQIVDRIDRVREELRANLEELETRAKEVTDWRHHFEKHPGKMVIAALVGGALLATLAKKHLP